MPDMGTAVGGDTTNSFMKAASAAGLNTPSGVMSVFDSFLTSMTQPVSWDQAKNTIELFLKHVPGGLDPGTEKAAEMAIEDRMHNYD